MRKITAIFLMIISVLTLVSCDKTKPKTTSPNIPTDPGIEVPDDIYTNDKIEVEETLSLITIKNNFITIGFDLDNGSLKKLSNNLAKTDYLIGTTGGNWAMMVDVSTNNPFRTDYQGENAHLVTSRNQYVEYQIEKAETNATLTLNYDVTFKVDNKNYSGIKVIEKIQVNKGSEEVTFDYEIQNNCSDAVTICNFTGAQLSGLQDSKTSSLNLFWPNKEGKIYENAINKIKEASGTKENLVNVYPGLCSMQLIQLYNSVESLYYMVKDDTREYKIANYGSFTDSEGYDYNGVSLDEKISLSFTQFPFIPSGQTKKLHQTVVGVSVNESWYAGSDSYQAFLYEAGMLNDYANFSQNWSGFLPLNASSYGSKHFATYKPSAVGEISYADWINQYGSESGVDTVVVNGWNQGGFDSMYPDYEFISGDSFDGEEGYKEMVDIIHNNGDLIVCHMNSRIADEGGNWSTTVIDEATGLTNLQNSGVKRAGFNRDLDPSEYDRYMVCESYSTGTMYYVMSSASKEFQAQVKSVVERLRKNGCNGLWYDQLFERDAYLDYDEEHIMSEKSTPATLYAEGYMQIFAYFDEVASTYNASDDWMIIAGGNGGDAFAKWVDVYGGNWSRKIGSVDNSQDSTIDQSGTENCDRHIMSPELINYTVPAKYIGQAGAGTLTGQSYEYARAFLFSSPFLVEAATTSTKNLINIYNYYPDVFYNGKYTDMKGLKVSKAEVIGSIILSDSEKAFVIQLFNESDVAGSISAQIDMKALGINGNITSVTNLFTGEEFQIKNNTLTCELGEYAFTSFYVTYE